MLRRCAALVPLLLVAALLGCGTTGPASTPAAPALTVSPSTTLTFASTTIGQTSATQSFSFTNTGNAPLTITFTIPANNSFAETSASTCTTSVNLAANAGCTLVFDFTPLSAGTFTDTITATDNASSSAVSLTLTGTGASSNGPPPPTEPILTVTPGTTLTFPSTAVGVTSATQAFTLTNTGTGTLIIGSYGSVGNTTSFTETSASTCSMPTTTLAINASCTLVFTFNPQTAGSLAEVLSATDNAAVTSVSLILEGTGTGGSNTAPVLTITPSTTLTFPPTTVGQTSAVQSFTFTNTGNATLTLGSYALTGATTSFAESSASSCSATTSTLTPSTSCTLVFTFDPQTTGALTETITATDNTASPNITLTLTGTGETTVTPSGYASISPGSLTFPLTNANVPSAPLTITLNNTGGASLALASIAIGGANAADFSETNNCPGSIGSAQFCNVFVTFTPLASSTTYNANVTFTDNSGSVAGSTQTVTLTGTSAAPVPTPLAVFSPSSLSFPNTNVGSMSASQTVTLSNPGTATLINIVLASSGTTITTGSNTVFPFTTTCGTTLAAGSSCTVTLSFAPGTSGTWNGTLTATDNAGTSPQMVTLSGTGLQATATLPLNYINFPLTQDGTTTPTQSITMTNNGNATLTGIALSLSGNDPGNFNLTTTCGTTLAAAASCNITASFSPNAATPFSAIIYVASSATTQPQQIALSGTGSATALTHTLYTFGPNAPAGVTGYITPTPIYTLINNATTSVDITMYQLADATFVSDLIADCSRGVKVRVLLDSSVEKTFNTPVYNQLNTSGTNCSAVFSNTTFQATHQSAITVDNLTTAIMTLDMVSANYATTRDFAYVEADASDISAIEATFTNDYQAGTPYNGTQGTNDFGYPPGSGDTSVAYPAGDLIWSPTTAQSDMLLLIAGAGTSLLVENPAFSATNIVSSLEADCLRGIAVDIVLTDDSATSPYSSYSTQLTALKGAGCHVHAYPDSAGSLAVHASAVIADYGIGSQAAYLGSISYTSGSMTENRELGLYVQDAPSITQLYNVMTADYAAAPAF